MTSVSTLQARLTAKRAQLVLLNAAYVEAVGSAGIKSYTLNTGAGQQSTTRRDLKEISDEITRLENQIAQLKRALCGGGLTNMSLRRY